MLRALVRAMRPRQWVKNLFVLAPLVFAHEAMRPGPTGRALFAFALFCAASSAVYLLNDLRDRDSDRAHPLKRLRPVASGELPAWLAATAAAGLAALGLGLSILLGSEVFLVLLAYLLLNGAYSFGLKDVVILDVMLVSFGFVLRVEAGGRAIGVAVSSWLLLCTIFLALFLAFSKRRHEITLLAAGAVSQRRVLEQYSPPFLDQMINVVTASAVVSYALYATAPETIAKHGRGLLLTLPFVLFGIFRYLYLIYLRPTEINPTEQLLVDLPFLVNLCVWGLAVMWVVYVA